MFPQSPPDHFVGQQGANYDGPTGEYQRTDVSTTTHHHQSQQSIRPYSTIVCSKCSHQQQLYFSPYPSPPASASLINTTGRSSYGPYPTPHPQQQQQQQQSLPASSEHNVYRSIHPSPAAHNPSIPKQSVPTKPTYHQQSTIPPKAQEPQQGPTNENNNTPPSYSHPHHHHHPQHQQQQPNPHSNQSQPQPQPQPTTSRRGETVLSRPIFTLPPPIDAKAVSRPDPSQVMVTMSQSAYMNIISRLTKLEERTAAEVSSPHQKAAGIWWSGPNAQILAYEHHHLKERCSSLEEEMGEILERLEDYDERLEDIETQNEKDRRRWSLSTTSGAGNAGSGIQRPDSGYATTPEYRPRQRQQNHHQQQHQQQFGWAAVPRDGDAIMQEAGVMIKTEPGTSAVDRFPCSSSSSAGRKRARSDPHDVEEGFLKKKRDS